jgi:hypothetical protein
MSRAEGVGEGDENMTDSRKSLSSLSRKIAGLAALSGAALGIGLVVGFAPASAAPISGAGLAPPGLQVEEAGYRHSRKYRQLYAEDAAPNVNYGYVYPGYRPWMPFRGSVEIEELQRMFPETNWPPSMRY